MRRILDAPIAALEAALDAAQDALDEIPYRLQAGPVGEEALQRYDAIEKALRILYQAQEELPVDHLLAEAIGVAETWLGEVRERETKSEEAEEQKETLEGELEDLVAAIEDARGML